jgi:hypothetical protein
VLLLFPTFLVFGTYRPSAQFGFDPGAQFVGKPGSK